jgi:hypothetical protein
VGVSVQNYFGLAIDWPGDWVGRSESRLCENSDITTWASTGFAPEHTTAVSGSLA